MKYRLFSHPCTAYQLILLGNLEPTPRGIMRKGDLVTIIHALWKIKTRRSAIYHEFERLIGKYEDMVKELMFIII